MDGARIRTEGLEGGVRGQDYSRLADISPENIESIDVVKGPAAATLYGTEASGGVIRITTKGGQEQDTRYNLSAEYGQLRDKTDYQPSLWNPRSLLGPEAADTVYSMNLLESESPFRIADIRSLQANVRGGGEVVRFFVSGEVSDEEGYVPTNSAEQTNVRTNFTLTPTPDLEATVTNGVTVGTTRLPEANNSPYGWVALSYIGSPWYKPIEHTDPNADGQGEPIETCPLNVEVARPRLAPVHLGRAGAADGGARPETRPRGDGSLPRGRRGRSRLRKRTRAASDLAPGPQAALKREPVPETGLTPRLFSASVGSGRPKTTGAVTATAHR